MGRMELKMQIDIGNDSFLAVEGRVRQGSQDIGLRYVAHIESEITSTVAGNWPVNAIHARALEREILSLGWHENPL